MSTRRPHIPRELTSDEYRSEIARQMTEATLQHRVEQLAVAYRWRFYHPPDNRPSGRTGRVQAIVAGYPDLTLVHPTRHQLVFAELKAQAGRISADQRGWHADLELAGHRVYLWRPADLLDGTIDHILAGGIT